MFKENVKFKIQLIGGDFVGKTALIDRYIDDVFSGEHYNSNYNVKRTRTIKFNGEVFDLEIIESRRCSKLGRGENPIVPYMDAYLVVFDMGDHFEGIDNWLNKISRVRNVSSPTVFFVANEFDRFRAVDSLDNNIAAHRNNNIHYIEVNPKTGRNVNELFDKCTREIYTKKFPNKKLLSEPKQKINFIQFVKEKINGIVDSFSKPIKTPIISLGLNAEYVAIKFYNTLKNSNDNRKLEINNPCSLLHKLVVENSYGVPEIKNIQAGGFKIFRGSAYEITHIEKNADNPLSYGDPIIKSMRILSEIFNLLVTDKAIDRVQCLTFLELLCKDIGVPEQWGMLKMRIKNIPEKKPLPSKKIEKPIEHPDFYEVRKNARTLFQAYIQNKNINDKNHFKNFPKEMLQLIAKFTAEDKTYYGNADMLSREYFTSPLSSKFFRTVRVHNNELGKDNEATQKTSPKNNLMFK